ncbi:MAG: CvpA family protein [Bacillus subtilis]|nr:CvpA family protein [Bacillus subtilis]
MTLIDFGSFGIGIIDVGIVIVAIIFGIIGWKSGFLLKIVQMASRHLRHHRLDHLRPSVRRRPRPVDRPDGQRQDPRISELADRAVHRANSPMRTAWPRSRRRSRASRPSSRNGSPKASSVEDIAASLVDTIHPVLVDVAMLVIAFIVLFLGSIIVFFVLKLVVKGVTKIPVIREIDKILGVLFGLVKIFAIILVLFFVLGLLMTIPSISAALAPFLEADMALSSEQFRLSKWIYDHNLLKDIINVFLTVNV